MKNKILLITTLLIFLLASANNIYAKGPNNEVGMENRNQEETQMNNQGEDVQVQIQNMNQEQENNQNTENEQNRNNQSDKTNQNGKINSEEHKSAVANFVQNLLELADRDGGIGEEVRKIAQEQNQSEQKTVQSMEKVQDRNKIKTFLIGSDYKNLGALRSEVAQTKNRLEQLNRLMENAQNDTDKTSIQDQINTLNQEQDKIENFIKDNENKFSMFGWFVKLFNK